jgi:Zn-dependent protease
MEPVTIALIIALVLSVVIHEMAHAHAANWQGDPTARLQGRLSPNPLVHIDPLGSIIVPLIMLIPASFVPGSPVFGWAKPVPYNPYNFRNQKWGEALVAFAGPLSNLVIATIFALLIRLSDPLGLSPMFIELALSVISINIFLALFNLVPIPPLDGSKILPRLLPYRLAMRYEGLRSTMEHNLAFSFVIVLFVFFFVLKDPIIFVVSTLTHLLAFA